MLSTSTYLENLSSSCPQGHLEYQSHVRTPQRHNSSSKVLGSLSLSLSWLSLKSEPGKKHIGLEYLIELSRSCRDVDPGTEVEKDVKCFILQLGENEAVDANKEDCVDE